MTGPAAAVAAVRAALRTALGDLPKGSHVVVACSGGADSLALAAATAFVAPRTGLTAGAAVVDHGWHPASASVAAAAAQACLRLGLAPVRVLDVADAVAGGRGGPEAAARDARYAALAQAADEQDAVAVLLGHTLDDQAETVLLGLARGAGGRSLAGMPARRGRLRRPLLDLSRTTTRDACAALGLTPHEDPANTDPAYTRVRVRRVMDVLEGALGPGLPAALARTAAQLAQDADALDAFAGDLLGRAGVAGGYDVAVLAAAPDAVRRRALLAAARSAGSPAGALGSRHALALDALVAGRRRGARHGPVHLPGGILATRACGTLSLAAPGDR
ncbi:MAG: tRNA lysidine(34) synthetase TilS [Kineosporiaceae bacterium]